MAIVSPRETDPLLSTNAIVDKEGRPTEYFLRQWVSQIGLNLSSEEVTEAVNALDALALIAGVGLVGGGVLGDGEDIEFDMEDTAVTPDTYGDANNVAQITVDQQGRLTDVQEVAIAGGGGGGESFAWPPEMDDVFSASAFAFKGTTLTMAVGMTVSGIGAFMATVSGHSYKVGVYRLDGSDNIDEITGVSAIISSPGTFASGTVVFIPLISNAVLVAGSRYVIVLGRTDGTGTFALGIATEAYLAQSMHYSNVPLVPYAEGTASPGAFGRIDSTNPGIGTAVDVASSASPFGLGFQFFL